MVANRLSGVVTSLIIAFFCLSLIFSFYYALWNKYWSDGDELHYLVMTQSLIEDRDFNLTNNYDQKDYLIHHGRDEGYGHTVKGIDGSHRSWHNILLPIMVSPGFAARNILGARLTVYLLHLLGCIGLLSYLRNLGFSKNIRFLTVGLYSFQLPIIVYAQYVYTDLLSGYLIVLAFLAIQEYISSGSRIWLGLASGIMGLGIFLHVKLLLAGMLVLASALIFSPKSSLRGWLQQVYSKKAYFTPTVKTWLELSVALLPWLIPLLIFSFVMYRWFGIFSPNAAHIIVFQGHVRTLGNPLKSLLGLGFDSENGLFANAPVLALMITGVVVWFQKQRRSFYLFALPMLLFLVAHSNFEVWRTWGPPARYLMVFIPPLIPALAFSLLYLSKRLWGLMLVILLTVTSLSLSVSLFFINNGGYPFYKGYNSFWRFLLVETIGLPVSFLEVIHIDMYNPYWTDYVRAIIILGVLVGLSWFASKDKTVILEK